MPRALLVNPWIYDFAAFDMWAAPLGILSIGALLKKAGWEVFFIDCTNRRHPALAERAAKEKPFHTGQYHAQEIPKPEALAWVPRRYKRYGIPEEIFLADLQKLPAPDEILVTSRMTYWYPGVQRAIEILRDIFPQSPIYLGGTYASLCPEHAQAVCKPDYLVCGEADFVDEMDSLPFPAWELLPSAKALPIETSRGCPFSCAYCASGRLFSGYRKKTPMRVVDEIEYALFELGAEDFAFTDDALLLDAPHHFEKIADEFLRRGLQARFHTPNSVFSSAISPSVAEKMRAMNFQTIRLSLETTNAERLRAMNRKMFPPHFEMAMKNLRAAGFGRKEIGAYIMAGMPGQDADETLEAIEFAKTCGARPHLAEYSPIPGTRAFFEAAAISRLDIRSEPLLHNNSIFYLLGGAIDMAAMEELKRACAMND